jgi:uncharacterized phiE125 gp8 family phage protein
MTAQTLDPVVSPVSTADLAAWLGVDAADPVLPALLVGATGRVIRFLGYDLIARDWVLTHWDWPTVGTPTKMGLSASPGAYAREIDLPYAKLVGVDTVTLYGDETVQYIERTDSIILPDFVPRPMNKSNDTPAMIVEYSAGFGLTGANVPGEIKQGITTLAAFEYEHRGACDATEALRKSGAREMLQPWVKPSNVVVY